MRTGSGYRFESLRTSLENAQHYVPEVLQEVEAIRYLYSIRRRLPDGVGILAAAIAADHFDAGVLGEPGGERTGIPVRQYVHQPVVLQIYQDGAPAMPAPEGEVVDAQDSWCRRLFESKGADVIE